MIVVDQTQHTLSGSEIKYTHYKNSLVDMKTPKFLIWNNELWTSFI